MPRRGSAFVSPVMSSSSSSSEGEGEDATVGWRRSQWRRRAQALSSSSSSSGSSDSSSDDDNEAAEGDDTDELEDFVDRRSSRRSDKSAVQLDRLRRIFLNKPPKATRRCHRDETHSTTASNSSGENVVLNTPKTEEDAAKVSLAIDHHVAALRDQVQRLARHHDAHAQQWQAVITQAIDELTFVKQQEERALQGHVRLLQESYALRLEMFEQQYRAKVAEIRDAMRAEIAEQRAHSESAVVAAAQRLQQQTQRLFQSDDATSTLSPAPPQAVLLAKTSAFLDRQRAREDARRLRRKAEAPPIKPPAPEAIALSPVARHRAKLRALEQKLASFSPATVDRVLRTVEQQRYRGPTGSESRTTPTKEEPIELQPTPLSPRRRRASCWHKGISREAREGEELEPPARQPLLSRRFLLPEEEQELLALRNSIGLAKDWMDKHGLR